MTATASTTNLKPQVWNNELFTDVMANLYFTRNGLMGKGPENIVQVKPDLKNRKGDTVHFELVGRLTGNGVDGDGALRGSEEQLLSYEFSTTIGQKRNAILTTGSLDEQRMAKATREKAKGALSTWLQELIERQIILKLAGVTNPTLTDVNGVVVSAACAWSNTPAYIPDADENAGVGARYICANAGGTTALAATDLLTPRLITRARVKAGLCNPMIQPISVGGESLYMMLVHPWQMADLKNNAILAQAFREAGERGKNNPIFSGVNTFVYDGVIVKEHPMVPFLDVSVAGNSFRAAASGTDCAVDCFRALLCGKQAAVFAECTNPNGWVEDPSIDYKNQVGFATGLLGGIQKTVYNSKEFGVIAVDTAATPL